MGDRLTETELAERAGTSVERVRELVDLGILEPEEGTFPRRDVMRARVVGDLEAKGIGAEALAQALASGHLRLGYLESAGRRFPRSDRTFTDLAERMGIPVETMQMVYVALGLPRPEPDERVREEDLPVLEGLPVLFSAGVGEGEVLRAVRVWGDSARRVAQFQSHYFHATIEEPFRQRGLSDNDAFEAAIREVGVRMGHSGEQMLAWLLRRHAEVFFVEHQFEHVETALEQAGVHRRPPRGAEAAVFADLTGYTSLTERAGDEVAASVSLTLAQLVSEVAARHRGTVVKMLGDGVHFYFRDPGDAVRGSLEIVEAVRPRGLPPAHIGVNAGPMIYDEGDYFGRTVNIAARIASRAAADQVFLGEDVVGAVEPRGFRIVEVGPVELKGIARPVTLYQAVRHGAA
ncbi:MAG TPA: adenylate/guanylate cyclase domain-containing protein [Actinomycetota bacterium]|nr:adenylate/guanylate cyclase domain-containing protein [Actinomycetota bacterium]